MASDSVAGARSSALSQRPQPGRRSPIASSVGGSNEETTASAGCSPRAARRTAAVASPWSSPLSSMSIQAPRQGGEHVVQRGTPWPASSAASRRSTPRRTALDAGERLVVEQHRDAVARQADVELHAVAARDPHGGRGAPRACSPARRASRRGARGGAAPPPLAWPRAPTRRPGAPRRRRGRTGTAWGRRTAGRSKQSARPPPDRAAHPDVVEAARVAVRVHARGDEARTAR